MINTLTVLVWRYFTGAHLTGRKYTNATWRKPGTMPKHSLTWWTAKPRFHRMAYRWIMVIVPAGLFYLYSHYRHWTEIIAIALFPYMAERAWKFIHARSTLNIGIPAHFEQTEGEEKVTPIAQPVQTVEGPLDGLTFEALPPEKKKRGA